ncbi:MAG: hypothetical protein IKJ74_07190 [Clostridia bacterium]|nr:hypothetical protein [Clostridia bacterium]
MAGAMDPPFLFVHMAGNVCRLFRQGALPILPGTAETVFLYEIDQRDPFTGGLKKVVPKTFYLGVTTEIFI